MSRYFEVMAATGEHARLTVTGQRVTLKVPLSFGFDAAFDLVRVATLIGNAVNPEHSLRGVFQVGRQSIWLFNNNRSVAYHYDRDGNLIETRERGQE